MMRIKGPVAGLAVFLCASCGPADPIRIGFIGGLSDRNSDVGQAGYNGLVLAAEQANRAGGIHGRHVEIVARDDAQSREVAVRNAQELAASDVEAVIGPYTSGMAKAVAPELAKGGKLMISPTISSLDFHGKDDNVVRINRTTRDNGSDYARVLHERGQRRVAAAYDTRNRSFTESWLAEFRRAFTARGGRVVAEIPYESSPDADFGRIVTAMIEAGPDGLLFIAGALDVARLAQQARKLDPRLPLTTSEWAGSEQLAELGGKVVEGLLIVQNFNRDDDSPRYLAFREAYFNRFQKAPGYPTVMTYDAATALFTALSRRREGESPQQALLRHGPYAGLQQELAFDANGDRLHRVWFTEIRDGRYRALR